MRNEHSASLGWRRRIALACIVVMGLGSIVGSGGGGDDPPAPPPPPPPTAQVIGIEGGPILTADKQIVGIIPQGAHKMAYSVSATVKSGRLTVDRKPVNGSILDPVGPMTIFLPPGPDGTDLVLTNACPATEIDASLRECWTTGIISPAFFGDTPGGAKHRLSRNELKTSLLSASIQVEYGAQLTSSEAPKSMPGRIPVLFVHGYILNGGFGGGDGTWAALPTQVRKLPLHSGGTPFVPFEFRWQTDASFITVANDLAQAVTAIHNATGSRVHIVAHSFGGLLARTLLQDINDATKGSPWSIRSKVMSLTTVGTPHSGIRKFAGSVETVPLPVGWNPEALVPDLAILCLQTSCYQAGIAPLGGLDDFVAFDLSGDIRLDPPPAGYVAARLHLGINQSIAPSGVGLPVLSLIGQSIGLSVISQDFVFRDGDGLISYRGQRFKHDATNERPGLLFETQTNFDFIITERVLGFGVREGAFPDDSVSTATARSGRSPYSTEHERGYWHEFYFRHFGQLNPLNPFLPRDGMLDVSVPEGEAPLDCADPCHDTWANLRELLLSQHGGPASTNFPTTSGQLERVAGVNFSPNPAVVGLPLTVTVVGDNLSADTTVSLPGCSAWLTLNGGKSSLRQFECVPTQAGPNLSGMVRSVNGTLLSSFAVSVNFGGSGNQPPTASFSRLATGLSVSFDASASGDSDGSIVSYTWTFGDAGVGSGKAIAHSFASAGSYNVTLTVTDDKGAAASIVQSITVSPVAPSQTASITQVLDNVGASTGPLAQGATTDDTTPTLSGTLSAALTATQSVRVFTGGTVLGAATVVGTTWSFTPTALASGNYSFTAAVVGTDGIEGNRSAAWILSIAAAVTSSATQVAMTATPDPVQPGQLVQYAITVSNRSTAIQYQVINALVPNNTTVSASSISQGASGTPAGCREAAVCAAGTMIQWGNDTGYPVVIAAGQSVTVTFAALVDITNPPPNGKLLRSTATATGVISLGTASGASAALDVLVSNADLSLGMVSGPSPVAPGGALSYTLRYGNPGATGSAAAVLAVPLPQGTSLISASDGGLLAGGLVQWNIGALSAGAVGQRQFVLKVDPQTIDGSLVTAAADLRDALSGRSLARANAASAVLAISGTQMAMTATPDPVRPGQLMQYSVTVSNRGAASQYHVISVQVPNNATVLAATISQGASGAQAGCNGAASCAPGTTIQWGNNTGYPVGIAAGQSVTVTFAALVDTTNPPPSGTLLRSTATATGVLSLGTGSGATAALDIAVSP